MAKNHYSADSALLLWSPPLPVSASCIGSDVCGPERASLFDAIMPGAMSAASLSFTPTLIG
jgi:hypothetical protein